MLVCLLAVLGRDRLAVSRYAVAAVGLLAAFTAWSALSTSWSVSAAQPILFTERTLVYVAALAAALLVARRGGGLVAGVVAATFVVCAYALVSRLAPGSIGSYPPPDGYQLEEPIGYWNGLAILASIGAICAATVAVEACDRRERALAAAALPGLVTALYLTFSRGGMLALAVGVCVAVAATRRRLHLLALLAVLGPFAVASAAYAARFAALTGASGSLADVRSAGHRVGAALVVCTLASAAVGWWLLPVLERRVVVGERLQRAIGSALAALVLVAALAVVVRAGGPAGVATRISDSFTRSLPANGGDLRRRLTSFSSDGRADYWRVAWREVRAHPVLGGGAGSYERWWHQYRPTAYEAQNAHNLYLETLAELGPAGLALLLAFLAVPFAAAARARDRPAAVAGAAAFAAFVAHAALDWDFQIPAVTVAALVCAAAVLVEAHGEAAARLLSGRAQLAASATFVLLAAAAIVIQVGNSAAANAADALDAGNPAAAAGLAARARTWEPWSYEPLQLGGEADLALGRRGAARASFEDALALDPANWSLWADLAQVSGGARRTAAITRARELNPRQVSAP